MAVRVLDRIEKTMVVRAPLARVWKAISDVKEFEKWFQVKAKGEFRPGAHVQMISTYPGHEGVEFFVDIQEVEPERMLSWRWYPGAKETSDPPTLVVFKLETTDAGTVIRITESGFDRISLDRRAKAFEENEHGWELQSQAIRSYVDKEF